jgi:DNA repair exonuclease SbcCD ATPase subunit
MKIREKLPFMPGSGQQEARPEEPPQAESPVTAAPPGPNEAKAAHQLGEAFETVGKVMVGELGSLRRSVKELESRLDRRIEAEKQATATAVDALGKEVLSKIDELRQNQQKTVSEAIANLRELLQRARDQADDRSKEVKEGLEKILLAKEQKLGNELSDLADRVSGVRRDLAQQVETAGTMGALLDNVANVFSVQKARQQGSGQVASSPPSPDAPGSGADGDSSGRSS